MKKTTSLLCSIFSLLLFFQCLTPSVYANSSNDDLILEITTQNNQLTLGISKNHVIIIINDDLRHFYNAEIKNFENKEWHTFTDSGGNYIPGTHSYLESEFIQIPISDIKNITFENGSINMMFTSNSRSPFKEVLSDLGSEFFNGFTNEDLESFYLAYLNIK